MPIKVPVIVTNRSAIIPHADAETRGVPTLTKIFRYKSPNYYFSPRYRMGLWDGYATQLRFNRAGAWIPTGVWLDKQKQCEEAGIQFLVTDEREAPKFGKFPAWIAEMLRYYQDNAVDALIKASGSGGLILNATGTGKTLIAGAYFSRLKGYGCFVVDELTLLEQARASFEALLHEHIGVVGNQIYDPARITVATCQTLMKHSKKPEFRKWFQKIDALFIDEIHLAMNRRSFKVVKRIQPMAVFGLTATLELQKADVRTNATSIAGPPIFEYPYEQAVKDKVLTKGVVCRVTCNQSGKFKDPTRDYDTVIVRSKKRNQLIEDLVREGRALGRTIVVLVSRLKHLDIMSRRLKDIKHEVICGKRKSTDRTKAQSKMNKRKLPLIIANVVFGKGIDISTIDMIIDGTAASSKNNASQRFGRGTRLDALKDGLLYFDISDHDGIGLPNRFQKAARRRARAFVAQKVPVILVSGTLPSHQIMEKALKALRKVLAKD